MKNYIFYIKALITTCHSTNIRETTSVPDKSLICKCYQFWQNYHQLNIMMNTIECVYLWAAGDRDAWWWGPTAIEVGADDATDRGVGHEHGSDPPFIVIHGWRRISSSSRRSRGSIRRHWIIRSLHSENRTNNGN